MKKIVSLISVCLCILIGATTVNSCSVEDILAKFMGGGDELVMNIEEEGDTMKLTIEWENCLEVYTATFANDKCTQLLHAKTWDDAEDAQYEYDNLTPAEQKQAKV